MMAEWTVENGDSTLSNTINGRMYEFTIDTPDVKITFIRKVYMLAGLEDQWHFDVIKHNHTFLKR